MFGTTLKAAIVGSVGAHQSFCDDGRVIVVGSGMSGLGAATVLRDQGCEVLVLEARDRIGGRTHTEEHAEGFWDVGAHWIEGNGLNNPIKKLILDYGLPYSTLRSNADDSHMETFALYDETSGILNETQLADVVALWNKQLDAIGDLADSRVNASEPDISLAEAFQATRSQLGALTEEQLRTLDWCISKVITSDDAGRFEADSLFSWWLDDSNDFSFYNGTSGGGDDFLLHGYGSLAKALAQGLDIRTGAVVTEIQYRRAGPPGSAVRAVLADGTYFDAAAIVASVPLGILKETGALSFDPPLPSSVQRAIQTIGFGLEDHVYLHYDSPSWSPDVYNFGYASSKAGLFADIYNMQREQLGSTLNMFVSGSFAMDTWTQLPDAEVRRIAESVVGTMFRQGEAAPSQAFMRTKWADDPFARGSYSYAAVNTTLDDRRSFTEAFSNERLVFAGEHTCALGYGLTQGAYVSGVKAARHVLGGAGLPVWPLVPEVLDLCDVVQPTPDTEWGVESIFPGATSGSRSTHRSRRSWLAASKALARQRRASGQASTTSILI